MATQPTSDTVASPQPALADKSNNGNSNIGIGDFDVIFATPSKPSTSGYRVHIGTYRNKTKAHRAHHLLEQINH